MAGRPPTLPTRTGPAGGGALPGAALPAAAAADKEFTFDDVESVLNDLSKNFTFGEELEREANKKFTPVFNDTTGLRECTPGVGNVKLKVVSLDNTTMDLDATEDWTVQDCINIIASRLGVDASLFHLQEENIVKQPPLRWLSNEKALKEEGITAGAKVTFRMRWFKIPKNYDQNPSMIAQVYSHLRHSFIVENTPMEKRHAVRLGALQLQVTYGAYEPDKFKPGVLAKTITDYINPMVLTDSNADALERKLLLLWPQHKALSLHAAMIAYITLAQEVPTFGAAMFDATGLGNAKRRVAVLDDGIAVYAGNIDDFTYIPYFEISDFALNPPQLAIGRAGQEAATATTGSSSTKAVAKDVIKVSSPYALEICEQACGYFHLLEGSIKVPPALPRPVALPPQDKFVCRKVREDIIRFQTRLDCFKFMFIKQIKDAKRTVPQKIIYQVTQALEANKPLETLNCAQCDLDDKYLQMMASAIDFAFKIQTRAALVENLSLTSLDLSGNQLKDYPGAYLAIKNILLSPMQIRTLVLRRIDVSKATHLNDALRSGRFLEVVNLAQNQNLNPQTLTEIMKTLDKSRTLTTFNIGYCNMRDAGFATAVADFVKRAAAESLTSLNLETAKIGTSGVQQIIAAMPVNNRMAELDFSEGELGPKGASAVLKFLEKSTTMRKIRLVDNHVTDKFCSRLGKLLISDHAPPMQSIDLALNEITKSGATALLNSLRKDGSKLQEVILSGNVISANMSKVISMCVLPSLTFTTLYVRACTLSKSSLSAIIDCIGKGNIRRLDLAFNEFNDSLTSRLAEAIKLTTTLEVLNVAKCGFSVKELAHFIEGLGYNKSIKDLQLNGLRFSEGSLSKLSEVLQTNRTLVILGLCELDISSHDLLPGSLSQADTITRLVSFIKAVPFATSLRRIDLRENKLMPVAIAEENARLPHVQLVVN
eukprot:TRINITY_DN5699_c0_g1_i1.p1 TRINITY_DN5699_c0_g1~~TRINITY_DN5699_c0_g1_i1.p1  ORF type:complete len:937 (+),score=279.50 TRINITY_DN5699_c0_g1_i1:38-2848(+)